MLTKRQTIISSVLVAMALGTAWAVRGKFGHEQGAAWAGAIGCMALILVSKRSDWYNKIFRVALAGAFGWGMGGMISYGIVVGYGRADDFGNAFYGLLMLFVIGALYGFTGGGLFGLALLDSKEIKIKWHSLLTEMVVFGLIGYGFLINQLEWFMTPPRSELWAVCFGASIAVAWFIIRAKQWNVLRVAVWASLGAGFGFAFGNFLQVLGTGSSLPFNFWNIMEYSIGFFGGLGMAYGTLTSTWPVSTDEPKKQSNLVPILLLVVFIPFVLWDNSFVAGKLKFILEEGGSDSTVFAFQSIAFITIVAAALIMLSKYYLAVYNYASVKTIFGLYLGVYTFLSFLLTGIYTHPIEQYLYLINITIILVALPSLTDTFEIREEQPKKWLMTLGLVVVIIAVLAFVAINTHGELKGGHVRFGVEQLSE